MNRKREPGRFATLVDGDGYTDEQLAFMRAIEDYKNATGDRFPTWCKVLEIAKALGYRKEE